MRRAATFIQFTLTVMLTVQDPPTIVSPEVGTNGSVTFRLWAPKASAVELSGNWMGATVC
jgi:hypothetical protein